MNAVTPTPTKPQLLRHTLQVCCLAAVFGLGGCYVYRPVVEPPAPGAYLALELNDRGRVGVADSLGPGLTRVEGELVSLTDSLYVLEVRRVRDVRGDNTRWAGESASVRQEFVRDVTIRELSKQRTGMLVGGIAVALVTFVVTRDLFGFGSPDDDGGGNGEPQSGSVGRWPPIPSPP